MVVEIKKTGDEGLLVKARRVKIVRSFKGEKIVRVVAVDSANDRQFMFDDVVLWHEPLTSDEYLFTIWQYK